MPNFHDSSDKPISPIDYIGYTECMDEIKQRISAIDFHLNVPINRADKANLESLALNFRKVCELIMMACQAAHTHLIGKKVREWRIKNIKKLITRYNPDFYMVPVRATKTDIEDLTDIDAFTLDELKAAYRASSGWLHARGPYGDSPDTKLALAAFRDWRVKIVRLLNSHRVKIDGGTFLYCSMNAGGTGKTHVAIFVRAADVVNADIIRRIEESEPPPLA